MLLKLNILHNVDQIQTELPDSVYVPFSLNKKPLHLYW